MFKLIYNIPVLYKPEILGTKLVKLYALMS